jgi:hypothetical protein
MNRTAWLNGRAAAMALGLALGIALARAVWPAMAQTPAKPDPAAATYYAVKSLSVDTARLADSIVELRDRVGELERRLAMVESTKLVPGR